MRWYCTYCDRNYLVKLLAMASSLARHERQPFTLLVVCLDELSRTLLNRLSLPYIATIPLHQFEAYDRELLNCRSNRNQMEYFWTLTPTVVLRLLERYHDIDQLTYLDADLYFFSSPDPMFAEHPAAPATISEHRFAHKYKVLERYGRFNVGLMIFRRSTAAFEILHWWRTKCIEWCHDRLEDGKFGDQLYLEQWPKLFPDVGVLSHPGVGVAPWNQNDHQFSSSQDEAPLIDDKPIIFYHFHSLDIATPGLYRPSKLLHYWFDLPVLKHCYLPYVRQLQQSFQTLQNLLPEFDCGMVKKELPLSHTMLADQATAQVLEQHMTDQKQTALGSGWVCCRLPIDPPDPNKLAELC